MALVFASWCPSHVQTDHIRKNLSMIAGSTDEPSLWKGRNLVA